MRRWLSAGLAVALSNGACGDASLTDGFSEGQTRIRIEPEQFVGNVPCLPGAEGALHAYVARLQQLPEGPAVADAAAPEPQSSPVVPCGQDVIFPAIANRSYAADIIAFDRPVSDEAVASTPPRWTASCGRGGSGGGDAGIDEFGPTRASRGATVPLRGCTPLVEASPAPGFSRLSIDVPSALGELECGAGPGQVLFVEALLDGRRSRATCGAPLAFELEAVTRYHDVLLTGYAALSAADAGVPPEPRDAAPPALDAALGDASADAGNDAGADAGPAAVPEAGAAPGGGEPFDAGASPPVGVARWRSQCFGRTAPGAVTRATCELFRPLAP